MMFFILKWLAIFIIGTVVGVIVRFGFSFLHFVFVENRMWQRWRTKVP